MASSLVCPKAVAVPAARRSPGLEAVYRANFATVWRVLRRLGVREEQLDDAAQDVFLVVQRKLDAFDPRAPVSSWVVAIALRVASAYRRRAARQPGERLDEAIPDTAPGPARAIELQESLRLLHEVLAELDDRLREVFVLSELEQLSVPEIAQALGANVNTVYSRLRTARRRFEAALVRRRGAGEGA